ncbi:BTB/POZ and MATH domain-containing protein 1 [Aegilops tauschii subsp. strangulata]|uniref:Speckle-type POZ protein-like protein n=2 Tax=Aegilops tauschii TaxID=37682 RepID=A0A453SZ62_AEGTS|nr:BTB/POZ and MATH domain-containing protein 1 [Aegilops tauschii subsp. strangulata]
MEHARTTSITRSERSVQLLEIQGFSTTASMDSDDFITSRWKVGGFEWQLRVYPSGQPCRNHASPWVALGLVLLHETVGVRASLGCQLVDQRGKINPSEEKRMSRIFYDAHDDSDLVPLMARHDVVKSGYLKDDTLTLRCTITVLKDIQIPRIPAEGVIALPSTNLHQHLGTLLQSETGADVTFIVCGESFAAHKDILAARSPVFKAQFFGDMKEKCSVRVEVEDMEAAAFRAMLHFILSDTAPELDQPLEEGTAMAQHLLAASDRYELDRLKLICEIKLSGGINVETAATTLALAEQHNCSKLKDKCIEFIVSTPAVLGAVLATEGYKHLEASCPLVLTELLKSVHLRKS